MPGKAEAFGIFLILLPGLLCAHLVQLLAVRRAQTDFERAVEGLIFSFVLYVLTLPFFGYSLPISWQQTPVNGTVSINLRWSQLAVLAVLSVVLGVAYAAAVNHDWLLGFFRWLRVTDRTSRKTVWNDVFQQLEGWVQVGLAGDIVVTGWLKYYSDEADESSLFLEEAAWVDKGGKSRAIDGPGVLITKEVGIEYVVFLHAAAGDAVEAQQLRAAVIDVRAPEEPS